MAYFGKDEVQANLKANWLTGSFLHRLDREVRHCQRNQSIGLPIGPDTSRIISELISVGVERQLANYVQDLDRRAVRYVDDITIGLDENEPEEGVVAAYERALSHFELDVNFQKTKVRSHKTEIDDQWRAEISKITVGRQVRKQRDEIDAYFSLAIKLAERSEKEAVLKWAVKTSRSFRIANKHYEYFIEWLLRLCRRAPACFPALAQILIDARHRGRQLPTESIKKFAVDHIRMHGAVGHAFEVSWMLFLCKGLNISIARGDVEIVFGMRSSVSALILMDLSRRGQVLGGIDDSAWRAMCANAEGLKSDIWLLAYEANKKGWWSDQPEDYVLADPIFGPMKRKGVYFYDERRNVLTTKKDVKLTVLRRRLEQVIFERWEEYF